MTLSILSSTYVKIALAVGFVASLLTIWAFLFGAPTPLVRLFSNQPVQKVTRYPVEVPIRETPVIQVQQVRNYTTPLPLPTRTPIPTATPLPTPTPRPDLKQMLDTALLAPSSSVKSSALRRVVERASKMGEHHLAIEAADAIPSSSAESSALAYAAICAAISREFELAMQAIESIGSSSAQSSAVMEVTEIQEIIMTEGELPRNDARYVMCIEDSR